MYIVHKLIKIYINQFNLKPPDLPPEVTIKHRICNNKNKRK